MKSLLKKNIVPLTIHQKIEYFNKINTSTAYEYYIAEIFNCYHYNDYVDVNKHIPKHDFGIDAVDPVHKILY